MNFPLLHYHGKRRERICPVSGPCFGWDLKELSRKTALYGNQKRKLHEPESKESTQPPGKGAEPAPARSCLPFAAVLHRACWKQPKPSQIPLALPGWRSPTHHCFVLPIVLRPLAKPWPPCTVIWHLQQRMMDTGLWGTSRTIRAGTPHLLKVSFTDRTTSPEIQLVLQLPIFLLGSCSHPHHSGC